MTDPITFIKSEIAQARQDIANDIERAELDAQIDLCQLLIESLKTQVLGLQAQRNAIPK